MDNLRYQTTQELEAKKFEGSCLRCGECCGSLDGDPCEHLAREGAGKHSCAIYPTRLGPQETVSGKIFTCVSMHDLIKQNALRQGCAYRNR
ncbi:hypothetical protein ACFL3J_01495 [Candidatus Omnitrophota bacterium]